MKKTILLFMLLTSLSIWSNEINTSKNPIWHDLITPNLQNSMSFYENVFGWEYQSFNVKGFKYALIKNKGEIIGSMIEVTNTKSSVWVSSLIVSPEQMRVRVKAIVDSGAVLMVKPLKIPGRGKQLIFKGLQGETFSLISDSEYIKPYEIKNQVGNWYGMELWASDINKAKVFYNTAFEAETKKVMYDNKPYYFFTVNGSNVGGLMKNPLTNMESQWVPYLNISNLDSVVNKVKELEGLVVLSPNSEVRNGSIGVIQDQYGAILCIQNK
jgi:uncharacterized protein